MERCERICLDFSLKHLGEPRFLTAMHLQAPVFTTLTGGTQSQYSFILPVTSEANICIASCGVYAAFAHPPILFVSAVGLSSHLKTPLSCYSALKFISNFKKIKLKHC